MTIRYLKDDNFKWNIESAKKELLKYLFYNYSTQSSAINTLNKTLSPEKMSAENAKISGRDFGINGYKKILNAAIKAVAKIKIGDLEEYITLNKGTEDLFNNIDDDFTVGDMANETLTAIQLGDEGSNVKRMEAFKKGFSKAEVDEILATAVVRTVNLKDGGTLKSWTLTETPDKKIQKIKDIGYRRVVLKDSRANKTALRRRSVGTSRQKGSGKRQAGKKGTQRAEPDKNPLAYSKGKEKGLKQALESQWNQTEIPLTKKIKESLGVDIEKMTNKSLVKRFDIRLRQLKVLLDAVDAFFVYEKKPEEEKYKKTAQVVTRKFGEKIVSNLKSLDTRTHKLTDRIQESSKNIDKIYLIQDKLNIVAKDFKIDIKELKDDKDKDAFTTAFKQIVDLIPETDLKIDIKELKMAKRLNSNKLLDELFMDIEKQVIKKARAFRNDLEALNKFLNQRRAEMNNLIKTFKKSKKDYIDKNYDYSTQKGSVDYNTDKEAKKLFDNLTEEAEKRFKKNVKNLEATYSMAMQIEKTPTGKYKPVIEARLLKNIQISSALKGDSAKRQIVEGNLRADTKKEIATTFRFINKRRRALDRIK